MTVTKEVECPTCQDILEVEFDESATDPQEITCEGCMTDYELELAADGALILHALADEEEEDDENAEEDETVIGIEDEDDEEEETA